MGFLPVELVLDLGSVELIEARPEFAELDRLNHFVGLDRNCVKPPEGETDRGEVPGDVPPVPGKATSGGLSELEVEPPRRGGMSWLGRRRVQATNEGDGMQVAASERHVLGDCQTAVERVKRTKSETSLFGQFRA